MENFQRERLPLPLALEKKVFKKNEIFLKIKLNRRKNLSRENLGLP
jgi:hypothetical protein